MSPENVNSAWVTHYAKKHSHLPETILGGKVRENVMKLGGDHGRETQKSA